MNNFTIDRKNFYAFLDSISLREDVSNVRFKGYGVSMTPFIRNGDTITIKIIDINDIIKKGDVVAVKQIEKEKIIIHRVVELKNNRYQIKGDNKFLPDGWFPKESIIGIITKIKRESGKQISFKPWQNVIIAFFSKTRFLNSLILPIARQIKQRTLKQLRNG